MTTTCRKLLAGLVLGLGLLLSACGSPSTGSLTPAGGTGAEGAQAARLSAPAYTLDSGDRIRIVVFRHEDLSGEFEIDGGGTFAMPLIGEINAAGLTARQLEDRIATRLKDGYLVDPQVSIEVLNYRPFFILGEVNAPGSYPYVSGMSVINAVALAGGFTYRAKEDGIEIQRGGSGAPSVVVTVDTPILPGDILRVPERFF
ncbi:MAG: polysaccharide biosynthesis/export family protein [Geminicoccaceae bacterium]